MIGGLQTLHVLNIGAIQMCERYIYQPCYQSQLNSHQF